MLLYLTKKNTGLHDFMLGYRLLWLDFNKKKKYFYTFWPKYNLYLRSYGQLLSMFLDLLVLAQLNPSLSTPTVMCMFWIRCMCMFIGLSKVMSKSWSLAICTVYISQLYGCTQLSTLSYWLPLDIHFITFMILKISFWSYVYSFTIKYVL